MAPPIPLDALPPIDLVVVSHDHFDHLDMATVQALAARGARFAVPLGVGAHLEAWAVPAAQISELDWGESVRVGDLELTATPARHYSGRNPLRRDQTLWASWVVKGPRHRLFFSGDSGYFDAFRAIGAAHGGTLQVAVWQTRPLLLTVALFFVFQAALRGRFDEVLVGRVVVAVSFL